MKTKGFAIFAGLLIIVGAVLGVIGMNKLDWNFYELDNRVFEEKFYEYTGETPLKSIKIETDSSLNIVKGDKLTLKYYVSEERTVEITTDAQNGAVEIKSKDNWKFSFSLFRFKNFKHELTVPDGVDVILDGADANIKAQNIAFKNIKLESVNLDIELKNCTAKTINIDSENADIEFESVVADSLTIKSQNLDVSLDDCVIGAIKTDSTNTTFKEWRVTANSIFTQSVNITFKVTVNGEKDFYTVKVDALNGSKSINEQVGTDPSKTITIKTANLSGYLDFSDIEVLSKNI